ncbi:MAG: flagellar biosynthesis protein FlhB [Legionellales bacterium]
MSEKTEKATPYKLQKAKEKGQVSKSTELTTSLSLLVLLGMITALWPKTLLEIQALMRHLLISAGTVPLSVDKINQLQQFILTKISNLWLPFALTGGMAIILITLAQTGLVWSTTPLTPDFKRLSIAKGFKKLFSMKTCFEALKSLFKLGLTFLLLFFVLKHKLPSIFKLLVTSPSQDLGIMMQLLLSTLFQLLLLLTGLSIIDKLYVGWKYNKDNRMSKQELKDEHKHREGDPKIKAKIKQIHHQLRQKTASLKQVKTADVVITNPTHLAIALKYDRAVMPAPKVVCKVQGEMVNQVKALAKKHGIPIVEHKIFARSLYKNIALNQWINSDLYPIAAGIFRELYNQRMPV